MTSFHIALYLVIFLSLQNEETKNIDRKYKSSGDDLRLVHAASVDSVDKAVETELTCFPTLNKTSTALLNDGDLIFSLKCL